MAEKTKTSITQEILDRLKVLGTLPHSPGTLMKLDREISNNDDISVEEVVDMVAQDARLVAGLIKLANSAKYRARDYQLGRCGDANWL